MAVTKAQIKREIKARGGCMKRSCSEFVSMIKRNADTMGKESIGPNTWLFWAIGFEYKEAMKAASRLAE